MIINGVLAVAFGLGLLSVVLVGAGFVGTSGIALAMTLVIGVVYVFGALEIRRFRAATAGLAAALGSIPQPLAGLGDWLGTVPAALRNTVRLRIEGERVALPGPALTPYLVGLLVMLGMLGTFLGMVLTFQGAVFALEGSTDLQGIRAALSAPIKGLGLAFGTSVAGVATSAMLGLLSAISRRERADVARTLDRHLLAEFRPFSHRHQQQETFAAIQAQAQALPVVAEKLQALMDSLERRSEQLGSQLKDQQAQFHEEAKQVYSALAGSVAASLTDSLVAGARAAGESITPVVAQAMRDVAQESRQLHVRASEAARAQLDGLAERFSATTATVADTWSGSLAAQARTGDALVRGLDAALGAFTERFEQRATALLGGVQASLAATQAAQTDADQARQQALTQSLVAMAAALQAEWQRAGTQAIGQQQATAAALEQSGRDILQRTQQQAGETLDALAQLVARSEALVTARTESETRWVSQQAERMEQLASLWRSEIGTLRSDEALRAAAALERLEALRVDEAARADATLARLEGLRADEAARGEAAVARLGELQGALAAHLATLGAALEAPLTRLLQTASEVPQAAAGVITELRQEMSRLSERDNRSLEERTRLVERIGDLLQTLQQTAGAQTAAIDSLVVSAGATLEHAGAQLSGTLEAQLAQAQGVAAQVGGSAVELSSLGESFGHGVQLFSASNERLMEALQRIEGAITQSIARSDEQLAYYVAQAREVIDLSIAAQQGIVEDLRRLDGRRAAQPAGAA
jgi:ABC-type amino acid transport system permease subunit